VVAAKAGPILSYICRHFGNIAHLKIRVEFVPIPRDGRRKKRRAGQPPSNPGYVSVVLDRRGEPGVRKQDMIETLHSFGSYTFEAAARAEQFRLNCELALRLYGKAITMGDQAAIYAVFAGTLGGDTMRKLLRIAEPRPTDTLSDEVASLSAPTRKLPDRPKGKRLVVWR
jgi:hypothetical protein